MISGRQALEDVKRAYREERGRLRALEARLEAANERIVAVDAARADQLATLARIRVGEPGRAAAPVTDVDDRLAAMLERRRATRAELEARVEELDASAQRLEDARDALTEAVEAASERLDAAEAATQARLEQDPAHQAQRERARAAERTAHHAAEKASQSEAERADKGRAYEADPLFTYLWRRGFGTSRYRGWGLTRWLDRKVARLTAYDRARANYARLLELPVRLREHADAMAAVAEEEIVELRRLDEAAREADGIPALERERDAAIEALERHDAAVAQAAQERQETAERLERMNRGEDEAYQEMVAFLTSELDREELKTLWREAIATPEPEDDRVVTELAALEAERARLSEAISDLKEAVASGRDRVRDLEAFLRGYTERHYDAPGTSFPDDDLIRNILTQFLTGAVQAHVLWRVLEGQRRGPTRRSSPTFGSGGFGRGTPWSGGSWPRSPSGGGGGFRPPSPGRPAGGMQRGGFTTGGKLVRGGFKTGRRR